MPDTLEPAQPPAVIRHVRTVLEQLRAENPALADSLKNILHGYARQLEKDNKPFTPETLLADARKGAEWLKSQKPVKAKIVKAPLEIYQEIINGFEKPLDIPVLEACRKGDLATLKALHKGGADITVQNNAAISLAADNGHLDCLTYLHQNGGDITALDNRPIIGATLNGHLDCLTYLHRNGADITARDNQAVIKAAANGHLDCLIYLHQNGGDITAQDNAAVTEAALNGHLDCLTYLHQNGADITAQYHRAVSGAALKGRLDCLIYLHQNGVDITAGKNEAVIKAAANGHFDCLTYLHQNGADITAQGNQAVTEAVDYGRLDCLFYLYRNGANIERLDTRQLSALASYREGFDLWKEIVRRNPPEGLHNENPRFFKQAAFAFLQPLLKKENYEERMQNIMAFTAACLFQTPDRAMQYLKAWGKHGNQPLHDLIHMIKLPQGDQFNSKDWGDAVLKCGPSMARLVKFADRIPSPARSADGKTWSYVATRALCAQFSYPRAAENPELAALCFEYNFVESGFNNALKVVGKGHSTVKNLPEISLDGDRFGMEGSRFYRLPPNDIRGLLLGEATNCCQSIGSEGQDCAEYGYQSPNGGFYVIENAKGRIVGQTFAWRTAGNGMCFDTLETLGQNISGDQWTKILKEAADELTRRQQDHDLTSLTVGMGGGTPESLKDTFGTRARPAKPLDYDGYTEAETQIVVWERKTPKPA